MTWYFQPTRRKNYFINLVLIYHYYNFIIGNYFKKKKSDRLGTVHVLLGTTKYTGSRSSILCIGIICSY